jgi:hypothetical protein
MYFDINKAQLSALGKSNEEKIMEKSEVLKFLKEKRILSTDMLPVIGMSFEVFLRYAQLSQQAQQKIVLKAIKKLDPEYCDACECTPCDCGYGSY